MQWCEWAEEIAYGPLALKPWEFEQLQPGEFYELLDGYQWRENHYCEIQAYFTAAAMSVHTKRPVKPTDLWKPAKERKNKHDKKADEEYLRKVFNL